MRTQVSVQASVIQGDFLFNSLKTVKPNYITYAEFCDQFLSWSEYTRALHFMNLSVQHFCGLWSPIFIPLSWPFLTDSDKLVWYHMAGKVGFPHSLLLHDHYELSQALSLSEVYCFCALGMKCIFNILVFLFMSFEVISCFCYWYFASSWNQRGIVHWKWNPLFMVPMCMTVLSGPANHTRTDSTVTEI
jgi:hypothetical protein